MEQRITAAPGRCGVVALAAASLAVGLAALLLPDLAVATHVLGTGDLDGPGFAQLVLWLAELALLISGSWLCLITLLVAGGAARGRHWTSRGVPAGLRRLVLAICGAGLVAGLTAPAHAADRPGTDPASRRSSLVAGLPLPDRATAAMHVSHLVALASAHPGPASPEATTPAKHRAWVTVRPGDTLWALAESTLDAAAGDARVTARWQRIHAANRQRIGPDPDVIVPGLRLLLPRSFDLREESR